MNMRSKIIIFLRIPIFVSLLFHIGCVSTPASQTDEAIKLSQQGLLPLAVKASAEAVELARQDRDTSPANLATALENYGTLLLGLNRFQEAEVAYREALELRVSGGAGDSVDLAQSHLDLGTLQSKIGRPEQASMHFAEALRLLDGAGGDRSLLRGTVLNNWAEIDIAAADYQAAKDRLQQARSALADLPKSDARPASLAIDVNMARIARQRGKFVHAKDLLEKVLVRQRRYLPAGSPQLAATLNNLAELRGELGDHVGARDLYVQSLSTMQAALGPNHPDVATISGNLALTLAALGREEEALQVVEHALGSVGETFGESRPQKASLLSVAADINFRMGRMGEAGQLTVRMLKLLNSTVGPDHPQTISAHFNAGELAQTVGDYATAKSHYDLIGRVVTKDHGDNVLLRFELLLHRAELDSLAGDLAQSRALFEQAAHLGSPLLGEGHPRLDRLRIGLAEVLERQGNIPESRRVEKDILGRIAERHARFGDKLDTQATRFLTRYLEQISARRDLVGAFEESFRIAQLLQKSSGAASIARMTARLSLGRGEISNLLRERQDETIRIRRFEDSVISTYGSNRTNPAENPRRIAAELTRARMRLDDLNARIGIILPQFDDFASLKPVLPRDITAVLAPDEALLAYHVASDSLWIWAINRDCRLVRRIPIGETDVANLVAEIRNGLDPRQASSSSRGGLPAFRADAARRLHDILISPVQECLGASSLIFVVPSGSLRYLPFEVLLTDGSKPRLTTPTEFRKAEWLVRKHAFSYLPAISNLKALRTGVRGTPNGRRFLGIGDPLLADHPSLPNRANARPRGDGSGGRTDAINTLPSLPETAEELLTMRETIGDGELMLRERATESYLKERSDLQEFGILAFATHGLTSGEIEHVTEPGLVLTPPGDPLAEDDGFLTAGEISELKLDADLVILSACNTATPKISSQVDDWSEIARAFLFAGSRSLLVSHWAVASQQTVTLTTRIIRNVARDHFGPAQAARHAMLEMIDDRENPIFSYPTIWAPFVIVGDGGNGAKKQASETVQGNKR